MHIYIPTYRRPNDQHTFRALGTETRKRVTFVVDEQDRRALSTRYGSQLGEDPFMVVPAEVNSIAKKRAYILSHTGYDKIMMFDDDLRFANRVGGAASWKLVPSTPNTVDEYLSLVESLLDSHVHGAIGPRQGNNTRKDSVDRNTRAMYALAYKPGPVRAVCELGRNETREDFDYTLQLLTKGFPNFVLNDICVDQRYNAPGGCSESRTVEASNADAWKLRNFFPDFVKVVEKEYKGSVKRAEVIVQWKKAFESCKTPHQFV